MSYSDRPEQAENNEPLKLQRLTQCLVDYIEDILCSSVLIIILVFLIANSIGGPFAKFATIVASFFGIFPIIFILFKQARKPTPDILSVFKCAFPLFIIGMISHAYLAKDIPAFSKIYVKYHETLGYASPLAWNLTFIKICFGIIIMIILFSLSLFLLFYGKEERERETRKLKQENDKLSTSVEKLSEEKTKSNITNWDQLIRTIIEKEGDILIIVGNLMLINTGKGITYLKKYLQGNNNEVKIITSEESCKQLDAIVDKISDADIASRITVTSYQPFWSVQGIAIIAKKDRGSIDRINPLGYFFYKIRESEDDKIPESGIYIDLSNPLCKNDLSEVSEGLRAHYAILKKLYYTQGGYSVEKTMEIQIDGTKEWKKHEPKKEINLGKYSRSNSGTVH